MVAQGGDRGLVTVFAARLDHALSQRLRPNSVLTSLELSRQLQIDRKTLANWRAGQTAFSLGDIVRIDAILAAAGCPGLYGEVVGSAPTASGPWTVERLDLDQMKDKLRGELLRAFQAGADPLEAAANLKLFEEANILCRVEATFFSVHVGSALPVDQSVRGKPIAGRSDAKYALMITQQLEEAENGPTLYRLASEGSGGAGIQYQRLALPGRGGVIITLPFERQVSPGLKIK